jgi:hypothetical protein
LKPPAIQSDFFSTVLITGNVVKDIKKVSENVVGFGGKAFAEEYSLSGWFKYIIPVEEVGSDIFINN